MEPIVCCIKYAKIAIVCTSFLIKFPLHNLVLQANCTKLVNFTINKCININVSVLFKSETKL